jgi:hypothetical protein
VNPEGFDVELRKSGMAEERYKTASKVYGFDGSPSWNPIPESLPCVLMLLFS